MYNLHCTSGFGSAIQIHVCEGVEGLRGLNGKYFCGNISLVFFCIGML